MKTSFQLYLHSRPRWVASHPTHIPRRPKKKPLRGKKVGFAEKKLRLWGLACAPAGGGIEGRAQNIAPLQLIRCLIVECGGMEPCVPTCEWLATTDPPRLTAPASAISKLRFRLRLSLACPQYAISDGRFAPRFAFSDGGFTPRGNLINSINS